jgi:hypothetical protein
MKLRGLVPNSYIHLSAQFHYLEYINRILFAVRKGAEGPTKDDSKNIAGLLKYMYSLCGVPSRSCLWPKKVYVQKTASRNCGVFGPKRQHSTVFLKLNFVESTKRICEQNTIVI